MWLEAAKAMSKFDEGVLNAVDAEGYPLSVRQTKLPYDPATGEMPVVLPENLGAVEGPASLLCHFHDEQLWGLRAILLKGRLEKRDAQWTFVTTSFDPPSMWQFMKRVRASTKSYLASRNLPWPKVNFDSLAEMWKDAKKIQNP